MMSSSLDCRTDRRAGDLGLTPPVAERMVNLAGLGAGDVVVLLGDMGGAVPAAVSRAGGCILPPSASARAAAVLWAMDGLQPSGLTATLAAMRRCLRPGGRLVAWATPDDGPNVPAVWPHIHRLVAAAGFASIIGSPAAAGWGDLAVVTGVYIGCVHGVTCRPTAHGELHG